MSPRRPLVVLLALLAALALGATACGDDSSAEPPADGDSVPDGTVSSDDTDGEDDDGLAADYCAVSAEVNTAGDDFDPTIASAEEVEAYFRGQFALADQAVEVAPDSILDEITAQREVLADAIAVLEPVDWDIMGNFETVTGLYQTDEFLAAAEDLARFDSEVCGFASATDAAAGDDSAPPERTPEEDAYCAFSAEMAARDGLPFDGSADDVEAYYRTLIADLEQASSLATSDLAADYDVVRDVFAEVVAIMETAAFDLDVAQPELDEYRADPEVSTPMDAAIARIEAYDADMCRLG